MAKEITNPSTHIIFTGPESSAKSTLAAHFSNQYQWPLVEEYAREYLKAKNEDYDLSDLVKMAEVQEKNISALANQNAIIDTDLLTILIWAEERFQTIPIEILKHYQPRKQDLYLLCKPDVAWQEDPLRENPRDRDRLFSIYQNELEKRNLLYALVEGQGKERIVNTQKKIQDFLLK